MSKSLKFSQLTDSLYIGETPIKADCDKLNEYGVRLVINMRAEKILLPTKATKKHIDVLWLPTLDSKFFPISKKKLDTGVRSALKTINMNGRVYVFCKKGRHRSVAMAAAILIAQGMTATQAINLIKKKHPSSDPEAPHINRVIERYDLEANTRD